MTRKPRQQWLWRLVPLWQSLRTKFITVIVLLQLIVMTLVTLVIQQRQTTMMLAESRKRAMVLATDLAALSEGYLLSYDFVKLEQMVRQIAAQDDVGYAIVQLHNGQVAGHSRQPEQQGQMLDDAVSQYALHTDVPLLQVVTHTALQGEGYDVAIPVFATGSTSKWGTVRIGFSLARVRQAMQKTTQDLLWLGVIALVLGSAGAVFLATRISRPIQRLVAGVNAVAQGHYDHAITAASRDEVGHLAWRFEEMRQALQQHVTRLDEEKRRLESANTTIMETQAQLIESEKLAVVGKIAAKVAHEVNNPLAIIKTSLHLITKRMPEDDPHKENLDIIKEEIARITRTIRELLDFARPTGDIATLHVNQVVQRLMKFLEADLHYHKIDCRLVCAEELPTVRISLDQFKQVLLNLLKNAREAMPEGGTLTVETARCRSGVSIAVSDTGVGIPEDHMRTIFEPFFSTKTQAGGMGLGLAVCANLLKSFGGSIDVTSQLGRGTTFHLYLAAYPPSIVGMSFQEGDTSQCNMKGPRGTILVIEDEKRLRTNLQLVLSGEDYTVTTAADGQEGISAPHPCVRLISSLLIS